MLRPRLPLLLYISQNSCDALALWRPCDFTIPLTFLQDVTSIGGSVATVVTDNAGDIVSTITSGAEGAYSTATDEAGDIVSSITSGAEGAYSTVTNEAGDIVSTITSDVQGAYSSATDAAGDAATGTDSDSGAKPTGAPLYAGGLLGAGLAAVALL